MGLEMVIISTLPNHKQEIIHVEPMKQVSEINGKAVYRLKLKPHKAGNFSYGIRLSPINDSLPYRQDFCYVKWI